ncbi:hypothetical protein STHU_09630 [Allostella humosa]|uniref:glycine zipper family protein n=1 Tax=Stella humosa TaxID=94 RepID=UPI001136054D|nr:glycine zipper family protein [Stella humosa]BBK30329.1 hypothetical protein STHU_09630 [Stella humosa]
MGKISVVAIATALLLGGCARTNYQPVVDFGSSPAGPGRYHADLAECQDLAAQRDPANAAAATAVAGALLGAALGAVVGGGRGAAFGAGLGGISGGASGGSAGLANQRQIVANCLSGRGYRVVGW